MEQTPPGEQQYQNLDLTPHSGTGLDVTCCSVFCVYPVPLLERHNLLEPYLYLYSSTGVFPITHRCHVISPIPSSNGGGCLLLAVEAGESDEKPAMLTMLSLHATDGAPALARAEHPPAHATGAAILSDGIRQQILTEFQAKKISKRANHARRHLDLLSYYNNSSAGKPPQKTTMSTNCNTSTKCNGCSTKGASTQIIYIYATHIL